MEFCGTCKFPQELFRTVTASCGSWPTLGLLDCWRNMICRGLPILITIMRSLSLPCSLLIICRFFALIQQKHMFHHIRSYQFISYQRKFRCPASLLRIFGSNWNLKAKNWDNMRSWKRLRSTAKSWDGLRRDDVKRDEMMWKGWREFWNEMRWDVREMRWNEKILDQMKWREIKLDERKWDELWDLRWNEKRSMKWQVKRLLQRCTKGLPAPYRHSLCSAL